jgi:hypothetical protein
MQRGIRVAMGAALAAVVVSLAPAPAQGQVRVEGRFRLPHGEIAVGVGDPYYGRRHGGGHYGYHRYPVGSYVPYGYRVQHRARLGYGFYSPAFACRAHRVRHAHWVPVRRYRTRYIVVERPVVVERYVERRSYRDRDYYEDGYSRDGYYEDGYGRDPYYDFNRELGDPGYRRPARHVHTDRCRH